MEEACQKCGEAGEDRRTLMMSCFYDMSELSVPFNEACIEGRFCNKIGKKEITQSYKGIPAITVSEYEEPDTSAKARKYAFYLLRVCKNCRADWMNSIERWFNSPAKDRESCGSGIFVRENGVNIEVTREEFRNRRTPKVYLSFGANRIDE